LSRGLSRGLSRDLASGESEGKTAAVLESLLNHPALKYPEDHGWEATSLPSLIAPLAPKATGLTTSDQPTLYWYISSDWGGVIGFSLNEPKAAEPVLEAFLEPSAGTTKHLAGFHQINLADYSVHLKPGVEYEWFVYIISDPLERTADSISSATIRLAESPPLENANIEALAQAGLWYDTIDALQQQIAKGGDISALRKQRAALMKQAQMPKVADFDLAALQQ